MAKTYCSLLLLLLLLVLVSLGSCDIAKDRDECANQLVGLSTCLSYVGGQAKTPTMDCCTGIKQVIKNSMKCLCILVKDRNDPSVAHFKINSTLALGLPAKCKAPNHDMSECIALLHLSPNSPEAKVYTDFGKDSAPATLASTSTAKPVNSTSTSAPIAPGPSNGGVAIPMLYAVLLWSFTFHYVF